MENASDVKNQLKIENILDVIKNFLLANSEGAILINGEWGSGKTYFWKNQIEPLAKEDNFKTAYISLNGVSDISELEHLTIVSILETLDNTEMKPFQKSVGIIMNIVSKAGSLFLKNSLSDIAKTIGLNKVSLSRYIFCFDDLDRCNLPITQSLGFINHLMEHQTARVLILADESKIIEFEEYQSRKEKLLKWSLQFERDFDNVTEVLLERSKRIYPELHPILMSNEEWLKASVSIIEVKNLRTLFFALDLFNVILSRLNEIEDKYQLEVFWFVLTLSHEFKMGRIFSTEDSMGLDTIGETFGFKLDNHENSSDFETNESYSFSYFKKYYNDVGRDYFFFKSLYAFVLSGFLDTNVLRIEMLARIPDPEKPEELAKEELLTYYFRKINEGRFIELTELVWKYSKEGLYPIYDYVRIANFYYFFSNNKLIERSQEEVEVMIDEGLKKSAMISHYDDHAIDNLLAFQSEIEKEREFKLKIKAIHFQLKKEAQRKEFDLLLSKFHFDEESIQVFFENFKFQKELFELTEVNHFFKVLINCESASLELIREKLRERYAPATIKEFYSTDFNFLENLKCMLENALATNQTNGRIKTFLIKELVQEIKKGMDKLR